MTAPSRTVHVSSPWFSRALMIVAAFLFLLLTLKEATIISGDLPWLLGGGLTAMTLSFLIP